LRAVDGVYILAPNSTLWNVPVRNYTRNGARRGDITMTIGSWNDIDLAQKTMLDVAATDRRVRREPAPTAFVATVGDSTVAITLHYWTSAADFFATQIDLTKRAKQAFDTEGISVPAPPPETPRQEAATTRR
jgi:small conductance mechanosensitive channel